MIKEVVDPTSGAILFKEDEETLLLKELAKRVTELENKVKKLEKFSK